MCLNHWHMFIFSDFFKNSHFLLNGPVDKIWKQRLLLIISLDEPRDLLMYLVLYHFVVNALSLVVAMLVKILYN